MDDYRGCLPFSIFFALPSCCPPFWSPPSLYDKVLQYSPFCKVASTKTGYSLIRTLIVCSLICTLKGCLLICTLPGCSLYYNNRKFTHLYIERMLYIDKVFHQLCIDIGSLSTHMLLTECLGTLDSPVHTYTVHWVQYVQCTYIVTYTLLTNPIQLMLRKICWRQKG